jgi:hypothetical protein
MVDIGGSRPKRSSVARPGLGPAPLVLVWPSRPPSLTSRAPQGPHDKILTPKKSQVNLSLGRFLNGKKIHKTEFSCFVEL